MADDKTKGNGHVKPAPIPTGPSKKVRDDYLKKVKEITKKTPPPPKPK